MSWTTSFRYRGPVMIEATCWCGRSCNGKDAYDRHLAEDEPHRLNIVIETSIAPASAPPQMLTGSI